MWVSFLFDAEHNPIFSGPTSSGVISSSYTAMPLMKKNKKISFAVDIITRLSIIGDEKTQVIFKFMSLSRIQIEFISILALQKIMASLVSQKKIFLKSLITVKSNILVIVK